MRQCSPPVIGSGSRPNLALTIRATWPAGTIGTDDAAGGGAGAGGNAAGGSAAGCAGAGPRMSGLDGACGASTPDPDPGGIRLGGPIDPGGRGIASKPGGVCARPDDAEKRTPHTTTKAAKGWRPRVLAAAPAIMMPVY